MSTGCTINFCYSKDVVAKLYRHFDGSPKEVLADLASFFADVKKQCGKDARFDDPSYLASKFVVWQALQYCDDNESPLDFLGVGIEIEDPMDIAYTYMIDCSKKKNKYPVITHKSLF